ncbi:MAG: hypothetical protein HY433_03410 [Candidatus Liptonbacteria bacterium]|nr:hypothetical protein [Candidatus Liptonbacteria bacterium]
MTKKTRRSLFYGLLLLFPLLGGAIILYAQGWRLDLETFRVRKVGAIYVKSFPASADIRLNGKLIENKTGILTRGTFINGLFPKNYKLALNAEGYLDWEEHIAVKPSLVSEIKYAVLIPKTAERVATSSVKNFWLVNQKPLIQNERGELLWDGSKLSGNEVIGWTADFKKILTEDKKNKAYFINDVSGGAPTSTNFNPSFSVQGGKNLGIRSPGFQKVLIDPGNDKNLLLQTSDSVSVFDISNNKLSATEKSSSTIIQFTASAYWFAWTTFNARGNTSDLTLYNRASQTRLNGKTFAGKTVKLDFRNGNKLGILQDDGGFYVERTGENPAQKTASDVKDFSFSKNKDLVAALEHNSVEIFSFGSENDYWRFRLPDNEKIERLEWYKDANHLFVIYPETVRFLDLNDKALENFPIIASGKPALYDEQSNKLYFVKNNGLWSLEFARD